MAILHAVTWSGRASESTSVQRMLGGALAALLFGLLAPIGCSGRSIALDSPNPLGEGGDGEQPGSGGATGGNGNSRGGSSAQGGSSSRAGSAGSVPPDAMEEPYVDPGCPDAEAPPGILECDPFAAVSGCPAGLACKPNIVHPFGDGCDQQTFSMLCRPAGLGVQGSECESAADCGDGFICVVGAGAGSLCLRMCPLDGSASCPAGYVCGETDARGVGVCA